MVLVCADYKETGNGLIQRHIKVDLTRPGINPAIKIEQVLDALLLQEPDDILAAYAMVANDDNITSILQSRQLVRDLPHGDINTAIDMTDLELPGFADVE